MGDLLSDELNTILKRKQRIAREGVRFPMCKECNDMYRFGADPAPDGGSLSEWVYALCAGQSQADSKLLQVIRQQEARIRELESIVAGYERGRFIRFTKWLHARWAKLTAR